MNAPGGADGAPGASGAGRGDLRRRLVALVAALLLGVTVGLVVERLAGTAWGYVAIPLALVVGWWRHADPTRCAGPGEPRH